MAVLRAQKRHELVIAAAAELIKVFPQARFLFVGDGPGRDRVEQEIRKAQLEDRILMTGYREDIPEILSFTDLGIISSVAEGVPQFLFQIMAMGKPVIATAVGGIPDIITSGVTGILIPPEDPAALVKAMVQALRDPESAGRLGEEGRRLVEQEYTVEKMAEKVYRVYQQVYERKQGNSLEIQDNR